MIPRISRDLLARAHLPKLRVAGSNPDSRFRFSRGSVIRRDPSGLSGDLQGVGCGGPPGFVDLSEATRRIVRL
jgi:hypothetical protein